MATTDDDAAGVILFVLDPKYEFCAPRYHDFSVYETSMDIDEAEGWFEKALGYEDSRVLAETAAALSRDAVSLPECRSDSGATPANAPHLQCNAGKVTPLQEISVNTLEVPENRGVSTVARSSLPVKRLHSDAAATQQQALTAPKTSMRNLTRYARDTMVKKVKKNFDKFMSRDDQSQKKQKVDGGKLTVPVEFEHWTDKRAQLRGKENIGGSSVKGGRLASPFVSLAEKVLKFQIKTPERFHSHSSLHEEPNTASQQPKPALKLTVPKPPDLETSQRARPPRAKSSLEIEEEMLAKMPKFKARPVNKKILEAPTLPAAPKSIPQLPEFQEFHLRTTERALQHACASSSSDTSEIDLKVRRKSAPGGIAEPHEPHLQTAARARPMKVKTSEEIELEELAKVPKFKARPLNKRIFESRGDMGVFRSQKRETTVPVEFHFATDERFPVQTTAAITDRFDKEAPPPTGPTVPAPFRLVTEERGAMKDMKFMQELFEREVTERRLRVPRANPLPFTTDIPAVPPKPCPKECTKPEPFELESVVKHEEELQRRAEELARIEQAEADMRYFRAQPFTCKSVFMPERSRMPLTEVQEFSFLVDSRAVERAEFDRKVMEKQNQHKQFREQLEAARKVEEEKVVKAMRKEMIPQARPMPLFAKPFIPHRSSREPTRAVSPRLRVMARKDHRRQSCEQRQSAERRKSIEVRRCSTLRTTTNNMR